MKLFLLLLPVLLLFSCSEESKVEPEVELVNLKLSVTSYTITNVTECDLSTRRDSVFNGLYLSKDLYFSRVYDEPSNDEELTVFKTNENGVLDVDLSEGKYRIRTSEYHSFIGATGEFMDDVLDVSSSTNLNEMIIRYSNMECCDSLQPCPVY